MDEINTPCNGTATCHLLHCKGCEECSRQCDCKESCACKPNVGEVELGGTGNLLYSTSKCALPQDQQGIHKSPFMELVGIDKSNKLLDYQGKPIVHPGDRWNCTDAPSKDNLDDCESCEYMRNLKANGKNQKLLQQNGVDTLLSLLEDSSESAESESAGWNCG